MIVNRNECILHAIHGSNRLVWFNENNSILYFIDKPFHGWEYGRISTQKEALNTYTHIRKDNWEILEDRLELIIPKLRK